MMDVVQTREVVDRWQVWRHRGYSAAKRLIDLAAATVLLLLLAPLLALVALAILLDSSGPVFFRQTRVGRGGKPFTIYKFRSMRTDADEAVHREYVTTLLRATNAGQDTAMRKVPNDRRITRIGAIIRKTSIDELPQLWNVLIGNMSLVGPRPPIPYEVEAYAPWMRRRLDVLPGITGLWQVSGRGQVSLDEMFQLDVSYVGRQSLALDLKILLLTIPTVLALRKTG